MKLFPATSVEEESSKSSGAITLPFELKPLGKALTFLFSPAMG